MPGVSERCRSGVLTFVARAAGRACTPANRAQATSAAEKAFIARMVIGREGGCRLCFELWGESRRALGVSFRKKRVFVLSPFGRSEGILSQCTAMSGFSVSDLRQEEGKVWNYTQPRRIGIAQMVEQTAEVDL